MSIKIMDKTKKAKIISEFAEAMRSNNAKLMEEKSEQLFEAICAQITADADAVRNSRDEAAELRARGYRVLTPKEKAFYENLIKAGKSSNPKQEFTSLISDGGMPETIIEDVYKDLKNEHPLLSRVKYVNVKYLTKWLLNDHIEQLAKWGEITDSVEKEVTSGFKVIDLKQSKLTAFLFLFKSLLDLGPTFLDNYVRTILKEAIACGLENGIVNGSGVKGEIVGINRNISKGASINTESGYSVKEAIMVDDFSPENYGALVAKLAINEKGRHRKITRVDLVVNPIDYLTKIMPATTVLTAEGKYSNDVFPFPTNVIQSTVVSQGEAHMSLLDEYFLGIGQSKDAAIEYSDHYKFLEGLRTYIATLYAAGVPSDNTMSIRLDISNLAPTYITVLNKQRVASEEITDQKIPDVPEV